MGSTDINPTPEQKVGGAPDAEHNDDIPTVYDALRDAYKPWLRPRAEQIYDQMQALRKEADKMSGLSDLLGQQTYPQGTISGASMADQYRNLTLQQASLTPYPTEPPSRYKTYTLRVEEISNGFVLVYGNERFYCADMAAVGERVIACMVTKEIMK